MMNTLCIFAWTMHDLVTVLMVGVFGLLFLLVWLSDVIERRRKK